MTPELQADLQALCDKHHVELLGVVTPAPVVGENFDLKPSN